MASRESGLAEVAEDFQASLEFLTNNDRFAISNFTIIARENTEDASDICDVLIEHIGKARPDHKLPALYVLDSIAKNIGTPYTLFLGHRLYSTFMQAYSAVDRLTRKKLDEMLKTWKNPVPGSTDPRPVFPVEITKKMENALLQVKTRAIQLEQQQQRAQQELFQRRVASTTPSMQWRSTPTPPQNGARYPPPPVSQGHGLANGHAPNQMFQSQPQPSPYQQPQTPQQFQPQSLSLPQYPVQAPSQSLDSLHRDIEELIRNAKDDYVRNMNDMNLQTKLKALVDLQLVLRQQQLPPEAIQAVRDQVRALQMGQIQRPPSQAPTPVPIQAPLQTLVTMPPPVSYSAPVLEQRPPPAPPQPVSQTPSTNQLASLLASVQRTLQSQQSTQQQAAQPITTPQPSLQTSSLAENPLFAQLRAAGLLNSASNANAVATPPMAPVQPPPAQPQQLNLSDLLRSVVSKPAPTPGSKIEHVEFTSASLKIPRPHLLSRLYEAKPNQCLTCGKRFSTAEEGRTAKARHLDWHFHTNQRLAESAQRGLSRSWYVGEMEWIKFRDEGDVISDESNVGKDGQASLGEGSRKDDPKTKFIPVPSDNALASQPCPICQEKFDVSRNEELQDFVWMDAIKIGNRVYHASCYADLKNDGANTPARTATPDSVLGKRKAEAASYNPSPAKALKGSTE